MTTGTAAPGLSRNREKRALYAASLFNGPAELLDFVLPLWAGLALGASAAEVGALMAVEMAVSVLVRPFAGILADRVERRWLAGTGALFYAVSCAGYAVAGNVPTAMGAAVLGGLGGAVFWVALRAMVAERLPRDPAVFPRLLSAEETGSWIAFVAAMSTVSLIGFRAVFLACAAACAVAAAALFSGPSRVEPLEAPAAGGIAALGRKLWPMLLTVITTMVAEAAVGLLLLLRLQRDFDLTVPQIALVFLPGGIAVSVLPPYLHRFTARFGRRTVLASASLSSAAFAASLAWAPNPWAIGALWVLSGAAWAAVIPIEQAVIAEASGGGRIGRGMGLYESACLVGAMLGSLFAGLLFDGPGWVVACLGSAAVIASGAVLMPFAVRRLGVADRPDGPSNPFDGSRPAGFADAMHALHIEPVDGEAMIADWHHVHNTIVPPAAMSVDEVRERTGRHRLAVAYLGEVLVGCSTVRPPEDGSAVATVIARILPEFRRRGLGGELYAHGLALAKELGAEVIETVVLGTNVDGMRFARKLGFVEVEDYVMPGETERWYTLRLA